MMVRFFNYGDGSGRAAVEYLLAEEVAAYTDDRKRIAGQTVRREVLPEVLSGDPELTRQLIDSNTRKWRYTSGVIAFHVDDDPSEIQQAALMRDFEKAAFAGLAEDQGNVLWVRHQHMGNVELHFLIPRIELYGNRSFNPAPPGTERYFNTFRDYWNACENWISPEDPRHKRMIKPVFDCGDRKQIKETLQALMIQKIEAGEVRSHADVRSVLGELEGLEFKPLTEKQVERRARADAAEAQGGKPRKRDVRITMRVAGTSDSQNTFRLEDRIFHEDWTADEYFAAKPTSEGGDANKRCRNPNAGDVERLRAAFVASVERRTAKNHGRYARLRKDEQVGPPRYDDRDWGSRGRDKMGDCTIGGKPEGVADRNLEDDVAELSGRGLSDLLGALDGGAANVSRHANLGDGAELNDLRPPRNESNPWPWRDRERGELTARRRARRLPNSQPEPQQSLHHNINNEVKHGAPTIDDLRDSIVTRCRRTQYNLRDWSEQSERRIDRIRDLETRIGAVRKRLGEAFERLGEAAGRIASAIESRLSLKPVAEAELKRRPKPTMAATSTPFSSGPN